MAGERSTRDFQRTQLGPAAAGASVGTLMVGLAGSLAMPPGLREWLLLSAPTLTVAVDAASRHVVKRYRRRSRLKQVEAGLAAAERALSNPHTSLDHKSKMRQLMEHLEMQGVNNIAPDFGSAYDQRSFAGRTTTDTRNPTPAPRSQSDPPGHQAQGMDGRPLRTEP